MYILDVIKEYIKKNNEKIKEKFYNKTEIDEKLKNLPSGTEGGHNILFKGTPQEQKPNMDFIGAVEVETVGDNTQITILDNTFDLREDLGNLKLDVDTEFDMVKNEFSKYIQKDKLDDTVIDSEKMWSSERISTELAKKANSATNHEHPNLDSVLNKLEESNSNLIFDSKTLMTCETYDTNKNGIVDKSEMADSLTGQLVSITEINHLLGVNSNIQQQIDSLSSGVDFKGEFPTISDRDSAIVNPTHGAWVIISNDENYGGARTQYIYSDTTNDWIYGGGYSSVNEATSSSKGIIQLAGDLTGTSNAPQLVDIGVTAGQYSYPKAISLDSKGRVISITSDTTLLQRIADLESKAMIHISKTQPANMKNGDFWIEA